MRGATSAAASSICSWLVSQRPEGDALTSGARIARQQPSSRTRRRGAGRPGRAARCCPTMTLQQRGIPVLPVSSSISESRLPPACRVESRSGSNPTLRLGTATHAEGRYVARQSRRPLRYRRPRLSACASAAARPSPRRRAKRPGTARSYAGKPHRAPVYGSAPDARDSAPRSSVLTAPGRCRRACGRRRSIAQNAAARPHRAPAWPAKHDATRRATCRGSRPAVHGPVLRSVSPGAR